MEGNSKMGYGKSLEIEPFVEGICFICKKPCEGYCHQECAISYDEEVKKRRQEALKKKKEKKGFK